MNSHRFSSDSKCTFRFGIGWVLLLLVVVPCLALGLTEKEMEQGNPIFIGIVLETGAVSFDAVPISERTVTVRVNQVLMKAPGVSLRGDDTVTVELKERSALKSGSRVIFATAAWISGKGLALKEIGHDLLPAALSAVSMQASIRLIETTKLSARATAADVVFSGRVTSIRVAAIATQTHQPITEHTPNWQEAIIQVDEGLKGVATNSQIVVRFPNSLDVNYFGMPRFTVGQDGIFLLNIDKVSGLPQATLSGREVSSYLVPTVGDVLPTSSINAIRTALGN